MPKLAFVVTEDWFFASHFLPMARAAVAMGLDVVVIARVRDHAEAIRTTGARVVPLEAERRSVNPLQAAGTVGRLAAILRAERPDIVHCISLKPILVGGAASVLAGVRRRVYALTGLGFLGARSDRRASLARGFVRAVTTGPLRSTATRFVFENRDDPALLGLDADAPDVAILGGAGIDPAAYPETPPPAGPTLRVAVVARMLWSKGIDTMVEAVEQARRDGAAVELSLYGKPDPSNPRAIPRATLEDWSHRPGIVWHGPTRDVAGVWREHHVAALASRGGEGLPRTLLESAACGRLSLTTDVPGCRSFVRDGLDGFVVPVDDAAALAGRLVQLAGDRGLVDRMGAAAAARVRDGYTEADVAAAVSRLYRRLLDA
ncbi:glycosyltransferase family 4 protein [Aureimonas pseudogalii]|uniref:Glycosyltransferase involved in cell wall biosynthesis n=1 Tax=Aureimonas pseudogalii TaxID=1744844 RepID=A0A7W6EF33_9HYPH|nr:glycosyltransferase family 4 protein [Aureimonas pseudogalii]MBB3998232.1 glycosyltransferase involved in cell wall biosynthesis [Aureimonas pseudogalii]